MVMILKIRLAGITTTPLSRAIFILSALLFCYFRLVLLMCCRINNRLAFKKFSRKLIYSESGEIFPRNVAHTAKSKANERTHVWVWISVLCGCVSSSNPCRDFSGRMLHDGVGERTQISTVEITCTLTSTLRVFVMIFGRVAHGDESIFSRQKSHYAVDNSDELSSSGNKARNLC